jgi:hypothetical protein
LIYSSIIAFPFLQLVESSESLTLTSKTQHTHLPVYTGVSRYVFNVVFDTITTS